MEITDVRIHLRDDEKLKAFVQITFDECFVVSGLKVIHGRKGLFVAMPSRRNPGGRYEDIAHPVHAEMRERLEERILEVYQTVRDGAGTTAS